MFYRLKLLWCALCFVCCLNIAYGNDVNNFDDLFSEFIPLEDKLAYLLSIKNGYNTFSKKDVKILIQFFVENEEIFKEFDESKNWNKTSENNKQDPKNIIKMKEEISCTVLKILLKKSIDGRVLSSEDMTFLAGVVGFILERPETSYRLRFLCLKMLIKINTLKLNTEDNLSQVVKGNFIHDIIEEYFSEEISGKLFDKVIKEQENSWFLRNKVEGDIFEPILLSELTNVSYAKVKKTTLYQYESYVLDHLRYFSINDNLKTLVEAAFFKTEYEEFKSRYIDAMFYLDMSETLIKIISDKSIDSNLRKQAIETSLKLLDQIEILRFKYFGKSLLKVLEDISSNLKEIKELRKVAKEKIKTIQINIQNHDDMKDLESIIFDSSISVNDKIKYLNYIVMEGFSFSKDNLEFVEKVFDDLDLDIRIKTKIADIVALKSTYSDVMENLMPYDRDSIIHLVLYYFDGSYRKNSMVYWMSFDGDVEESVFNPVEDAFGLSFVNNDKTLVDRLCQIEFDDECKRNIRQLYRFDQWEILINILHNFPEKEGLLRFVIKTCLDLLPRTRHFEEFSEAFLKELQSLIDKDKSEEGFLYEEDKDLIDYILTGVKKGNLSLKKGNCAFKFMFKD